MTPHIVVLGAGYSGLVAAQLAAKRTNATVTLINERDRFVERVRLHQLAAGQTLRDVPLAKLVDGTRVRLVVDRVTEIDAGQRLVRLARASQPVRYDMLIYALGSAADLDTVPGVAEHAYHVADREHALHLRERLRDGGVVAVVGGGLTGIEAATELAETNPGLKVRLMTSGTVGEGLSQRGRAHLRRVFDRLGIEARENVRVTEVRANGLLLAGGEHVDADTVVWTTGFRVPCLAGDAGFAVDDHGRMIVDDTLRSVSHPEVYGIGDAAAAHRGDGQELRMACATGLPTAAHAVQSIVDRMAGREPRPLNFRYVNQCISLGRRDALVQFVHRDDRPREAVLTGRFAALYKETIVRGALLAQRRPGMLALLSPRDHWLPTKAG